MQGTTTPKYIKSVRLHSFMV